MTFDLSKISFFIGLSIYALQGPRLFAVFFVLALPFLLAGLKFKLDLSKTVIIILVVILPFLLRGLSNPLLYADIKIIVLWLISFLVFYTFWIKTSMQLQKRSLLIFAATILFTYIVLILLFDTSPYLNRDLPQYMAFRTMGPFLVISVLPALFYAKFELKTDKTYFLVNGILIVANVLNGGLQNLVLLFISNFIYLLDFKKNSFKTLLLVSIVAGGFVIAFVKYIPQRQKEKISELTNPQESNTLITRFSDLSYLLSKGEPKNKWFGDGFGTRSTVYRYNPRNPALSKFRSFLEIDNGFYYIYHRMGFAGLALFAILMTSALIGNNLKVKLIGISFFIIINSLSIHFFSVSSSAIILTLLIFERDKNINDGW